MKRQSVAGLFESDITPLTKDDHGHINPFNGSAKIYIGIDNGVSGSIGIVAPDGQFFFSAMPVKKELSYTKEAKYINRVKVFDLINIFKDNGITSTTNCLVLLERPMINPKRWVATMSAIRALEATLIVVDDLLHLPFEYLDSKKWQKELLPNRKGSEELKDASFQIGNRWFPKYADYKHPDRDSLLMALYAQRNKL